MSLWQTGRDELLNADRMGYVRDLEHVAGFESHRFSRRPEPVGERLGERWTVVQLQLISLLKHETPVAYASDELPDMAMLDALSTRPLDEFEETSLARLRGEEDVITEMRTERIRMVGSLRASTQCLHCHEVSRGVLLGALTYELVPEMALRSIAASLGETN